MTFVELSHPIRAGMTTYPGLPGPVIASHLTFEQSHGSYAAGTEFQIGRIEMVANTGTYLDTPAHRWREGHDLSGLALERCADLPALVVDARRAGHALGPDALPDLGAVGGLAVLVWTGWDRHWGTAAYGDPDHPHLTEAAARALAGAGVALVGIDSVNVDDTRTGERPAHSVLLAAGVPVVEHLTGLGRLPTTGSRFTAAPPLVEGLATFPVRAYAVLR